jgi:hypothetical protein
LRPFPLIPEPAALPGRRDARDESARRPERPAKKPHIGWSNGKNARFRRAGKLGRRDAGGVAPYPNAIPLRPVFFSHVNRAASSFLVGVSKGGPST